MTATITNDPLPEYSEGTTVSVLHYRVDTFVTSHLLYPEPRTNPTRSFADERATFLSMLPMLHARHLGEYVAIARGEIAENGLSRTEVVRRFFQRFGEGPVYVGFVGQKKIVRQASPFRSRPNASLP
jgi:hypothetical protein